MATPATRSNQNAGHSCPRRTYLRQSRLRGDADSPRSSLAAWPENILSSTSPLPESGYSAAQAGRCDRCPLEEAPATVRLAECPLPRTPPPATTFAALSEL